MLNVQEIETSRLKPWEGNPRLNDHAVDAVADSIRTFGFNVPILCDQHLTIIAGHTRWKAAEKLGMTCVPVISLTMTDSQRRAFSVADNKTAEIADWDFPRLRDVLEELRSEDTDLGTLGYSNEELQALLVPEESFDWDAFDDQLTNEHNSTHTLLPVKVRREKCTAFKKAIQDHASKEGISEKDPAIAAGNVFGSLLGVQ